MVHKQQTISDDTQKTPTDNNLTQPPHHLEQQQQPTKSQTNSIQGKASTSLLADISPDTRLRIEKAKHNVNPLTNKDNNNNKDNINLYSLLCHKDNIEERRQSVISIKQLVEEKNPKITGNIARIVVFMKSILRDDENSAFERDTLELVLEMFRRHWAHLTYSLDDLLPPVFYRLSTESAHTDVCEEIVDVVLEKVSHEFLIPATRRMIVHAYNSGLASCYSFIVFLTKLSEKYPAYFTTFTHLKPFVSNLIEIALTDTTPNSVKTVACDALSALYNTSTATFVTTFKSLPEREYSEGKKLLAPVIPDLELELNMQTPGARAKLREEIIASITNSESPLKKPAETPRKHLTPTKFAQRRQQIFENYQQEEEKEQGCKAEEIVLLPCTQKIVAALGEATSKRYVKCAEGFGELSRILRFGEDLTEPDARAIVHALCRCTEASQHTLMRSTGLLYLKSFIETYDLLPEDLCYIFAAVATMASEYTIGIDRTQSLAGEIISTLEAADTNIYFRALLLTVCMREENVNKGVLEAALRSMGRLFVHSEVRGFLEAHEDDFVDAVAKHLNSNEVGIRRESVACIGEFSYVICEGNVSEKVRSALSSLQIKIVEHYVERKRKKGETVLNNKV